MHASLASLTFGAEFEVILPRHFSRVGAGQRLAQIIGRPVDAGFAPQSRNWKIVNDGSLRGHGTPLEFVSPVLCGQDGLDQIAAVANALRDMGATVNSSCGFHVHVGVSGSDLSFFKNLVKLYGRFESVIDSFMPATRRGNEAVYCRSVSRVAPAAIENADSVSSLSYAISRASGSCGLRYHKVNLEAYTKHRTVEFRQHAGTVDAGKAVNWIVTCLRLVTAAKEGKTGEGQMVALAIDHAMFQIKTRAVLEMCGRPEGATSREICERFGFAVLSIKRHATLAGVSYTTRGKRFYVTAQVPAPASQAVPLTVEGLAGLIGSTPEERAYFAGRRAALAR